MSEMVVRIRAGASTTTDGYGNPVAGADAERELPTLGIAPRVSSEFNEPGRTAVIVGLTVFFPGGTDVLSTDRFRVRGTVYEVVGEAGDWRSPFTGRRPGIEVALKRVMG